LFSVTCWVRLAKFIYFANRSPAEEFPGGFCLRGTRCVEVDATILIYGTKMRGIVIGKIRTCSLHAPGKKSQIAI